MAHIICIIGRTIPPTRVAAEDQEQLTLGNILGRDEPLLIINNRVLIKRIRLSGTLDPFASRNVRRATGLTRKEAQAEQERRAHDRITQESSVVRFLQVLGVVFIVGSLGGWTAHAK